MIGGVPKVSLHVKLAARIQSPRICRIGTIKLLFLLRITKPTICLHFKTSVTSEQMCLCKFMLLRALCAQPPSRKPGFVTYDNEASLCVIVTSMFCWIILRLLSAEDGPTASKWKSYAPLPECGFSHQLVQGSAAAAEIKKAIATAKFISDERW